MRREGCGDDGPHQQAIPVLLPQPRLRAKRQKGANPSLPLTDAQENPAPHVAHEVDDVAPRLPGEDMALRGDEAEEHPLPRHGQVDSVPRRSLFYPMTPGIYEGAFHSGDTSPTTSRQAGTRSVK